MSNSARTRASLLILCYHAISDQWPSVAAVAPGALDRHLRHVLRLGYRPRTLSAALGDALGQRTVVVTFDDAFRSVFETGLQIMARLGVPGTLFVPTDPAGDAELMTWSSLAQWAGTANETELRCMSWDQIRQLAAAGWEIGSHTCSHPDLTELDDERAARELRLSRQAVSTETGQACRSIAYPYGRHDGRIRHLAREVGYAVAVTLGGRTLAALGDHGPLEVPREALYRSTSDFELRLRAQPTLRRLRSSSAWRRLAPARLLRT